MGKKKHSSIYHSLSISQEVCLTQRGFLYLNVNTLTDVLWASPTTFTVLTDGEHKRTGICPSWNKTWQTLAYCLLCWDQFPSNNFSSMLQYMPGINPWCYLPVLCLPFFLWVTCLMSTIDGAAYLQIKNPVNLQHSPEGEPNHSPVFAMTQHRGASKAGLGIVMSSFNSGPLSWNFIVASSTLQHTPYHDVNSRQYLTNFRVPVHLFLMYFHFHTWRLYFLHFTSSCLCLDMHGTSRSHCFGWQFIEVFILNFFMHWL